MGVLKGLFLVGLVVNCSVTVWADAGQPAEAQTRMIVKALALKDPVLEAKLVELSDAHFKTLKAWHAQHDGQLKTDWAAFYATRNAHDPAGTAKALADISALYAAQAGEHKHFVDGLSSLLNPEQVEKAKDALTIGKVSFTMGGFEAVNPGLTEKQKAFILNELKAAREEAIDALSIKKEMFDFFKKHKDVIEAYLTAEGYDLKKDRADYTARIQAEKAKSAGTSKTDAAGEP